jgi:DNA helicase-2/ATP-dependent DNA helicase PcrA
MHALDEYQKKAVLLKNPNVLAIAGAGSGKTTTLVSKINYLLDAGEDPNKIFCITFTNSAAEEIQLRLNDDIANISTLHSLGYKWLKKISPELNLIDEEEIAEILVDIADIVGYRSKSKSKLLALKCNFHKELKDKEKAIKNLYFSKLKSYSLIDYDTILVKFASFLKTGIISIPINFLLIDEFQDTSAEDMACYLSLKAKSHFLVGDPRQAIYQFRGASSEFIKKCDEYFDDLGKVFLNNNYRSNSSICEVCNSIANNYPPMISTKDIESSASSILPKVVEFRDEYDEHHYVIGLVKNILLNQPNATTALLFRTHAVKEKYRKLLLQYDVMENTPSSGYKDQVILCLIFLHIYLNPENAFANKKYLKFLGASDAVITERLKSLPIIKFDKEMTVQQNLMNHGISQKFIDIVDFPYTADYDIFNAIEAINEFKSNSNSDYTSITLSTIHGAKGREWDNVIIPECNNANFPFKGKDTEEERNIFYVACSRAKKTLSLTYSQNFKTNFGSYNCDQTIYM